MLFTHWHQKRSFKAGEMTMEPALIHLKHDVTKGLANSEESPVAVVPEPSWPARIAVGTPICPRDENTVMIENTASSPPATRTENGT